MDIVTCINKIYELMRLTESGVIPVEKVTSAIADAIDEYKYGKVEKSTIEELLGCDSETIESYLRHATVSDFRKHISEFKSYHTVYITNN
jgi:hypothetical protein